MSREKVIFTILGCFPIAFALALFVLAANLLVQSFQVDAGANAALQGFIYMGIAILSLLACAMLYAAYKIFAYIREHQ